jgi:uncharacterized protein (TIGR01777 family)
VRVTVTGASGLIGSALVAELGERGAEVTVLSRDPSRAREELGVEAMRWDPLGEPAPVEALAGADTVVHLAGENIAQRWSERAKRAIRDSRVLGTRNLLAGLEMAGQMEGARARGEAGAAGGRPRTLISGSAVGYYGPRGEEPLDEDALPGGDFLAETCVAWEAEAQRAEALGMRVALVRTGVVLNRDGGALQKMLPPFRLGVGGPVAGGAQYMSWIHREDLVGMICAALQDERWSGPVNGTAPAPVTNREFSRALGRALHRPSLLPVPGFALGLLYGEMAEIVTTGARVMPAKALVLGYSFRHPTLDEALRSALC